MGTVSKQRLLEQFARVGKTMASPARIELLDLLAQSEKPVEALAKETGRSVTSTSNHLKELRTAGLVETRRDGVRIYYRLSSEAVAALVRAVQDVARRHLAEVERVVADAFATPDALEPVAAAELARRIELADVIVLDVRPADEYRAGHIPGAVSVPPDEMEARLRNLPTGSEVVAYCRGRYCVYAHDAVKLLRSRGYDARRMETGIPEWRAAGYAVAVGEGR